MQRCRFLIFIFSARFEVPAEFFRFLLRGAEQAALPRASAKLLHFL
jgi:hypothetical protein